MKRIRGRVASKSLGGTSCQEYISSLAIYILYSAMLQSTNCDKATEVGSLPTTGWLIRPATSPCPAWDQPPSHRGPHVQSRQGLEVSSICGSATSCGLFGFGQSFSQVQFGANELTLKSARVVFYLCDYVCLCYFYFWEGVGFGFWSVGLCCWRSCSYSQILFHCQEIKNKQIDTIFELFSKEKTNGACGPDSCLLGVVFLFGVFVLDRCIAMTILVPVPNRCKQLCLPNKRMQQFGGRQGAGA